LSSQGPSDATSIEGGRDNAKRWKKKRDNNGERERLEKRRMRREIN